MSRWLAAARGGVLLRQLPDAVFERFSARFRLPLRPLPRRASRFRRRLLLRRLCVTPPRTGPPLQVRQSQVPGASARESPGRGAAPRRILRRHRARALALASPMAKGIQSIRAVGAQYRRPYRHSGGPGPAPSALHFRPGWSQQCRPPSKRGRSVRLPARRPMKRILLVDDVMTTGSTAAACALALKRAGAARVALLTVARVARRMDASRAAAHSTKGELV